MKTMKFCLAAMMMMASPIAHAATADDLAKAEKKVYDVWADMPLTQRSVTFITEPSTGYGIYNEKAGNVFKPGEKIITYLEPIGFGWKELPGDLYEISFVSDLKLTAANGDVVTDQKGFAKNAFRSHNGNMEFSMDFTLSLTGTPSGKYTLEYTVHDMSGQQVSTFDQDIEIADGA